MGNFVNFYLPYTDKSGKRVSSQDQALSIITKAQELIGGGSPGVAITYSANYGQTQTIHQTYDSGGWNTHTSGANQADVMQAMESLMGDEKHSSLQQCLKIAPITTMTYSGYGGQTHKQVVESDLQYIKSLLDAGWAVLGWQNQDSIPGYSIGGGVSERPDEHGVVQFPQDLKDLVQTTLAKYAVDYPQESSISSAVVAAATSLPQPKPGKVTINGESFDLVAFYYPGHNKPWDDEYQAPFLGNFWPCSFTMTINSIAGTFRNAEAAFQATKWWKNDMVRKRFENAKTGDDALNIKEELASDGWDYSYSGLGRDGAMLHVVSAKFNLPVFKTALLATGNAYLLEHNAKKGRDSYWSDDNDGSGNNMLGKTLMEVRKQLGGSGAPTGSYSVADFTHQIGGVA